MTHSTDEHFYRPTGSGLWTWADLKRNVRIVVEDLVTPTIYGFICSSLRVHVLDVVSCARRGTGSQLLPFDGHSWSTMGVIPAKSLRLLAS